MYNRYIPQPDGSYRRNSMAEPQRPQEHTTPSAPPPPPPVTVPPPCICSSCANRHTKNTAHSCKPSQPTQGTGILGFLKQLLPKDFDAEDFLVILILLLMSGDCGENQNSALLTLALYLFL